MLHWPRTLVSSWLNHLVAQNFLWPQTTAALESTRPRLLQFHFCGSFHKCSRRSGICVALAVRKSLDPRPHWPNASWFTANWENVKVNYAARDSKVRTTSACCVIWWLLQWRNSSRMDRQFATRVTVINALFDDTWRETIINCKLTLAGWMNAKCLIFYSKQQSQKQTLRRKKEKAEYSLSYKNDSLTKNCTG